MTWGVTCAQNRLITFQELSVPGRHHSRVDHPEAPCVSAPVQPRLYVHVCACTCVRVCVCVCKCAGRCAAGLCVSLGFFFFNIFIPREYKLMVVTSNKRSELLGIIYTQHKIKYRLFSVSQGIDKHTGENVYKNKYFHLNSSFEKTHSLS